jgi:hypothetical protein
LYLGQEVFLVSEVEDHRLEVTRTGRGIVGVLQSRGARPA